MRDDSITSILGQTKVFENDDDDDDVCFASSPATHLSRPTAKVDVKGKASMRDIDIDIDIDINIHKTVTYSPLIRVVRIYLKSPVLSTGAALVDLPGTDSFGSSTARRAVAENYMTHCDSLWMVSPIDRAADEKSRAALLQPQPAAAAVSGRRDRKPQLCVHQDRLMARRAELLEPTQQP